MQVGILGPLEVRADGGRLIDVAGPRLRALLIRLVLDAGRPVGVANLVDAVWGERPPADETNALQTLVSRLRRTLGDADSVKQSPAGYRLVLDRDDVDAYRFERAAADGSAALRAGDAMTASRLLAEAIALWRGPALMDVGEFAEVSVMRLHDLRLAVLLDRIDADLTLGRAGSVAAELDALASEHPLHERLAALLMTALAGTGRQADALQAYERVRARLADGLGVDPSAELQAVHLAVLRGELGSAAGEQPSAPRSNLRAQLTSFVGREDEVARIGKSLEANRLVTIVGPGGAGKTRLASEAAARIEDGAPDGIWLVELASVTDVADLPQTVLGSLGLREAHLLDRRAQLSSRDATSRLLESLADKSALLILDNCEHLVEGSARLTDNLLAQCPKLRVLTTSREPLGIFGETLLVLSPLGQPPPDARPAEAIEYPAVRLFADRAAAVSPDFTIEDTTVATVIDIVRRLDGLPLAIELAAARLRSLPLGEIAERLSDRFRLLTGGSRTALPRHRTLRAVVEWSWDLLTPAERTLIERLAVFPAGATTASAIAVCADDSLAADDVADLLASLVDKSLLQRVAGGARLRMLETIREYGLERLAERDELRALRAGHADYFAALLREAEPHLLSSDQIPWFDLLTAERDNIMAAMRFRCDCGEADGALEIAISIGGFAMLLGNNAEIPIWLGEALAVPGGTDQELRWAGEALAAMGSAMTTTVSAGTIDESQDRLKGVVAHLDDVDTARHPLIGLLRPAVAFFADDTDRAARYIAEALDSENDWVAAAVLMLRGALGENEGDVEAMRADTAAALSEFRRLGERWGMASTLRAMAQLHTLDGDLDAASAAYDEALRLMAEMNSRDDESLMRVRLADLCIRRGDVEGARAQIRLAQANNDATGSAIEAVFTLCMLAEVEWHSGDLDQARRLHAQAMQRMAAIPVAHPIQGHGRSMVLAIATRLATAEGDLHTAGERGREAYATAIGTKDLPIVAMVGVALAGLAERSGNCVRAAELLGAAAALRGAEDRTASDVRRLFQTLPSELGAGAFGTAYERGRALGRDSALALLDPQQ